METGYILFLEIIFLYPRGFIILTPASHVEEFELMVKSLHQTGALTVIET